VQVEAAEVHVVVLVVEMVVAAVLATEVLLGSRRESKYYVA